MPKVPEKPDKLPPAPTAALEGFSGDEFGEPPALFIARYGRLIDTRYIRPPPPPMPPEEDRDRLTDLGRMNLSFPTCHFRNLQLPIGSE